MSGAMTLGELIDALAAMPQDAPVVYVGAGLDGQSPEDFDSWRGIYAWLALGHGATPCTARDLLAQAQNADGATYYGYKGGENYMDRSTPVYIDNYSCYSDRFLAEARLLKSSRGDFVRLIVKKEA